LNSAEHLPVTSVGIRSVPVSCSTYDTGWLNAGIQPSVPKGPAIFFF